MPSPKVSLLEGGPTPTHPPRRADRTIPEIPMNLLTILGIFISIVIVVFLAAFRPSAGGKKTIGTGSWEEVWRERLKK